MAVNFLYLAWFIIYLLIVLAVGLWGWQNVDSQSDFATASQTLSLPLAMGSLFASFMSALTVIGGIGYASNFGWAYMTLYSTGAVAALLFLSMTAKKWQNIRVNSLPEMLHVRYNSDLLRALTAVIIVFTYAIILISQLFGIGYIVEGIIGIPMPIALVTVGLFFTGYTMLGGMQSVARTDLIQAGVMIIGVLIMAYAVITRLLSDPAHSLTEIQSLNDIYGGQTPDNLGVFAIFLVYAMGMAIHPYYVQRIIAAKDVKTARLVSSLDSLLIVVFYLLITVVGIGGAIYLPNQTGDTMAPAIITQLVGGILGPIAMMAIVAGVQSTTDSLLHIVGVYISNDIYGVYIADDPSDDQLLRLSRISTGIFGVIVVAIATYQAISGQIALIAIIGTFGWSTLGGSLFIATAAGMFWKGATTEGALAAVILGFVGGLVGQVLYDQGILPFQAILLAVGLSTIGLVVVSFFTEPVREENLKAIFPNTTSSTSSSDD